MTVEIIGGVDAQGIRCLQSLVSDGLITSASYRENTDSTNTSAVNDLRSGLITTEQLPRIYLADLQTAGRGRQGRVWMSDKKNLAFTIALRDEPLRLSSVGLQSIAVGVAIADAIEHEFAPIKTKLKWPNDIWIDGGKFGGILIERASTVADCIVVGVGLNVGDAPTRQEINNSVSAKSLTNCLGRTVSKWDVLDAVIRRLIEVQRNLKDDPESVIDSFRRRCLLTGNPISYQHEGTTQMGLCMGIDDSGRLLVKRDDRVLTITSGEATLVRVERGGK